MSLSESPKFYPTSDKGVLHKSVVFEGEVHIVEEIQLLKSSESIKNLLLSSQVSISWYLLTYGPTFTASFFAAPGTYYMTALPVLVEHV